MISTVNYVAFGFLSQQIHLYELNRNVVYICIFRLVNNLRVQLRLVDHLKQQGQNARKRKIRAVEGGSFNSGKGVWPLRRPSGGWRSPRLPQKSQSKRFHKQNLQN